MTTLIRVKKTSNGAYVGQYRNEDGTQYSKFLNKFEKAAYITDCLELGSEYIIEYTKKDDSETVTRYVKPLSCHLSAKNKLYYKCVDLELVEADADNVYRNFMLDGIKESVAA